jgi:hypothetical protein
MKKKTGFALLSAEQKRSMSSRGGKTAHAKGTGRRWDSEGARAAAKLGQEKRRQNRQKALEMAVTVGAE